MLHRRAAVNRDEHLDAGGINHRTTDLGQLNRKGALRTRGQELWDATGIAKADANWRLVHPHLGAIAAARDDVKPSITIEVKDRHVVHTEQVGLRDGEALLLERHVWGVAQVSVDQGAAIAARNVHINVGDDHIGEAVVVEVVRPRVATESGGVLEVVRGEGRLTLAIVALVQEVGVHVVVNHHQVKTPITIEVVHRDKVRRGLVHNVVAVEHPFVGGVVVRHRDMLRRVQRGLLHDVHHAVTIHVSDGTCRTESGEAHFTGETAVGFVSEEA